MAARDILFTGAILFILASSFFVLKFTSTTITDKLTMSPLNESAQAVSALRASDAAVSKSDYLFFGAFIALFLGLIITGWFIGGVPIFMFIYFLFIVVATLVGAFLSNFWETTTTASIFGTTILSFPITNHIMLYLPFYLAVFGTAGLIVMFAKPREAL